MTSISSGSSLGSLTSTSSHSSVSYGLTDVFNHVSQRATEAPQIDLTLLHKRVERLLKFREMNFMSTDISGSQTAEPLEYSSGVFPEANKMLSSANVLPTYEQHLERQREQKVPGKFLK
jgi:hypothetical protein